MNLSIIIPTYNRESVLLESLTQIVSLYPHEDLEICVINDHHQDLSISNSFNDDRVIFVKNPGNGAASARNLGVKKSSREVLLFLDDDIILTEGHLEKHVETIRRFPNNIITANRKEREDLVNLLQETTFGRYKHKHDYIWHDGFAKNRIDDRYSEIDGAATFSCSIPRSIFEELGGFDESFPFAGSEDYDLFERAKKKGHKLIFDQENYCYHNEPFNANMDIWMSRHYKGVASFILLCNKHPEIRRSDRYVLYQSVKLKDAFSINLFRLKTILLSSSLGMKVTKMLIEFGNRVNWSDRLMTRLFNAMFVGFVKKGFKDFSHLDKHEK